MFLREKGHAWNNLEQEEFKLSVGKNSFTKGTVRQWSRLLREVAM